MLRFLPILIVASILFMCTPKTVKKEVVIPEDPVKADLAYVIRENINFRAANNTSAEIIGELTNGEPVKVIQNVDGWYQIVTDENQTGWVRSDLVGPRSMSYTRMAAAFVDSILPAFSAEMYLDKTDLYKTIYLTLNDKYYADATSARTYARKIGKAYQEKVYSGAVELRVLEPHGQELYLRDNLPAVGLGKVSLPVLPFGRILDLMTSGYALKMYLAVPDDIEENKLIDTAQMIAARYDLPVKKVEIIMIEDDEDAITDFRSGSDELECLLYYLEDKDGQDFRLNACQ